MRRDKGERAKVVKCLVRGRDDGEADPCGYLQGVRQFQAPVQLLCEDGNVSTTMGERINQSLASQPGHVPPPFALRVEGGFKQAHVFYKHEQGEGGTKIGPPSEDPATGWQAPHQGLIQRG